ncbi:uncharacterized protein L969DRAFT_91409 [Mixia osmundae IAM 14324]|uniref:Spindle pole body component n=1 Tax=Mixia osmundae (strain CBS 9802 / IAM 14324 / JCM 22182 / KY 12970) TaxID=764103 RepID=G7E3T4_MIXOS|nr:uncharacterized protein L969DRAFT_91409 [Mixia osmundae IAM 14324]KEI41939.1 hypothetical protein L969DRAFT_91409 [Mixia osmundae IAM 14324]GAA97494.1 hypothetical protein E5Q_04172 [Mixia osmundae IAM 14324]
MSRPSSRGSSVRPKSSASNGATAPIPFTPRHKSRHASSDTQAAREQLEIKQALASARKYTRSAEAEDDDDEDFYDDQLKPVRLVPFGTYLANSRALVEAPLNTRVPQAVPRCLRPKQHALSNGDARHGLAPPAVISATAAIATPAVDLTRVDVKTQEALLVEDLLFILVGIEGEIITYSKEYASDEGYDPERETIALHETLNHSLAMLVRRVLPLAGYYTAIEAFVQSFSRAEHGAVSHALCAGIRDVLQDYTSVISALEDRYQHDPNFTLQRLLFYVRPMQHKLGLIQFLIDELRTEPQNTDDDVIDEDDLTVLTPRLKWQSAGPVRGGEVIAVIEEFIARYSGDPEAQDLYTSLLRKSSRPYAALLLAWITSGELLDAYDEFMIRDNKLIDVSAFDTELSHDAWTLKYTLKDTSLIAAPTSEAMTGVPASRRNIRCAGRGGGGIIPACLQSRKDKILQTGKYINVLRRCGKAASVGPLQAVQDGTNLLITDRGYLAMIDAACLRANEELLRVLMTDYDLPLHLRVLKQNFLIDRGDAFTHFLDIAQTELDKRATRVDLPRLQSLYEIAIRTSLYVVANEQHKDEVLLQLESETMIERQCRVLDTSEPAPDLNAESSAARPKTYKGFEVLSMNYKVAFPLSIVLSRSSLLKYQLIFRHLLSLKHMERSLNDLWTRHSKSKVWQVRSKHLALEAARNRIFALRAQMSIFIQQLHSFAVHEVLGPGTAELQKQLHAATAVEDLLQTHTRFLESSIKTLTLTHPRVLKTASRLMQIIERFCQGHPNIEEQLDFCQTQASKPNIDVNMIPITKFDEYASAFEQNWQASQRTYRDNVAYIASSETVSLLPLALRLSSITPE